MKKIILLTAVAAMLMSAYGIYASKTNNELVYVDVNKLMDGYKRTKIERNKFEVKAKQLSANVDSLVSDWQKELQLYEKERSGMSTKEKELKQQLLVNKQQQINSYQQAIQKQIEEEDKKSTQTVINDINDFVKSYGKENKLPIIFGANGAGNIMYADKATDLTDKILTEMNYAFKGK